MITPIYGSGGCFFNNGAAYINLVEISFKKI